MTIEELENLLIDDIKSFQEDLKIARTEQFKDFTQGRIKEAEWILSKLA